MKEKYGYTYCVAKDGGNEAYNTICVSIVWGENDQFLSNRGWHQKFLIDGRRNIAPFLSKIHTLNWINIINKPKIQWQYFSGQYTSSPVDWQDCFVGSSEINL